jgi:hypothetical protein
MHKSNILVSRKAVVLAAVIALAGLTASRVNAASVFMWVADGSSVTGYSTAGAAVSGANVSCGGDCFSVATSGTSGTSENLFIADAGSHTLSEYSWNGTGLTSSGTPFTFAPDAAGGSISPQEIAIGPAGNLWTTSFDGQIVTYNGTTGANTTVYAAGFNSSELAGARGIMVNGTTVYVTVQKAYGSGGAVYSFSTSGGSISTYATIAGGTLGTPAYEDGQMRGITVDQGGNIFYADSTWAPNGTNDGYICESITCTPSAPAMGSLAGPNEIQTGAGTLTNGRAPGCDVLYIANYYSGNSTAPSTVEEVSTGYTTAGVASGCGSFDSGTGTFLSLTTGNISGIALSPGENSLGGDSVSLGPTFISNSPPQSPEPGTFVLMTGALVLALGIGIRVQRRRRLQ